MRQLRHPHARLGTHPSTNRRPTSKTGGATPIDFLEVIADAYDVIATQPGILETVIGEIDADDDGYITASDLVDAGIVPYAFLAEGIINQFDQDGDGKFSTADIVAFEKNNQDPDKTTGPDGECPQKYYQKECANGFIMYPNPKTCEFGPCPASPAPAPADLDEGKKGWYDISIPTAMVLTGTTSDEMNTKEAQNTLKKAIRDGVVAQRADDSKYKDVKATLLCATPKNDYDKAKPQAACEKAGMEYDDDFEEEKKGDKGKKDSRLRRLAAYATDGRDEQHEGQAPLQRQLGQTDLVVSYTLVVHVNGKPATADDVFASVMADLKAAVEEAATFSGPLQDAMYELGADIDQDQTLDMIATSTSYSITKGRKHYSTSELVGIGVGFFLAGMAFLATCFYIGFKRGSCAFVSRIRDQPPVAHSNTVEVTTLTAQQLDSIATNNGHATLADVQIVEATPVQQPGSPSPQVVSASKERTGVMSSGALISANSVVPLTTRLVKLEATLGLDAGTAGATQRVQDLEGAMGVRSHTATSLPQRVSALEAAINGASARNPEVDINRGMV